MSLTLKASELRDLIAPVLPLVGDDRSLPVLAAVLIEAKGEYVTATATDRYRLGISRIKPQVEAPKAFTALVPAAVLKRLLATFKPTRLDNPDLILSVAGGALTVEQSGALAGFTGTTLTAPLEPGAYPNVAKIITEAMAAEPQPVEAAFAVEYLTGFRAAVRHGDPIVLRVGANEKPTLVTIGEHFVGAVMPKRIEAHPTAAAHAEWAALLAPAPEKKPARKRTTKRSPEAVA